MSEVIWIVLIPLFGTIFGSAGVFFLKHSAHYAERILTGVAAGVMMAASIWSLILPAVEASADMGSLRFLPPLAGVWAGYLFLLVLERWIPKIREESRTAEKLEKNTLILLAVTLHNLPEGMAVGAAAAGYLTGSLSVNTLLSLSIGIALQNIPEGAIISMPLKSSGIKKWRSFSAGVFSGIVEPIGAILTVLLAQLLIPILPGMLCFAAGAMLYVIVEELIPSNTAAPHPIWEILAFPTGFTIMMTLDIALG